jgi:poly(3-hydroxybutyrate) depolymerase
VPHDCVDEIGCNVHFAFHACGGSAQDVANTWGLTEFAATNRIIMVYPDAVCWGYNNTLTDDMMFTYDGMMPKAIVSMMERVTLSPSDLIYQ